MLNTNMYGITHCLQDSPTSPEPELNASLHEMSHSTLESPASPEPEPNTSVHEITQSILELDVSLEHELTDGCSYPRSNMYGQPTTPPCQKDTMDYTFSPSPHEEIISGCPNYQEARKSDWSMLSAPLSPIPYWSSLEESNSSFSLVNQPLSPIPHSSSFEESNSDYSSVDSMLSSSASSSHHNEDSNSNWSSFHSQASSEASNSGFDADSTWATDSGYQTHMSTDPTIDETVWSCWSTFNIPEEQDITAAYDSGYIEEE